VRIPEWTQVTKVTCQVNGRRHDPVWDGNYIRLRDLGQGDEVAVEFPVRDRTLFRQIGTAPYKLRIKGNTVVDINPEGMIYPLYQRDHYLQHKAPSRKVTRFVPEDRIAW